MVSVQTKTSLKGFTLIELLVVIAVIGVLAGAIIVAINPTAQLARARDAGRKSDLRQIASAVERYAVMNGHYPVTTGGVPQSYAGGGGWMADCWRQDLTWVHDSGNYEALAGDLKKQPHDPSKICRWPGDGVGPGTYAYASDGVKYALVASLESLSDPQRTELKHYTFPWGGDTATFGGAGNPYTYWITSN